MEITVQYFAAIRERLGLREETLELADGADVAGLWRALVDRHPELEGLRRVVRVSVNLEFAHDASPLRPGDEVALIPPVAGGHDDAVRLTDAPLLLDDVIARVRRPSAGAIATFSGVVRDHNEGHAVTTLEYEVYPRMAVAKLAEIERSIEADFPDVQCAICHRYGALRVGDLAVVIAVSSPHCARAFEACAQTIDRVKLSVPIWKKETGPDGSTWVGMGS